MTHGAKAPVEQRLPLGTALLSNVALSLFLWNIALRLVGFLTA